MSWLAKKYPLIPAEVLSSPLIPADAGIQSLPKRKSFLLLAFSLMLDSRFRGNERSLR
jgi:hypothetical protein